MKKILLGAAALVLLASLGACDNKSSQASSPEADSLSITYGKYVGTMVAADFGRMKTDSTPSNAKSKLLEGVDYIIKNGQDKNYAMGVAIGSQILNEIEHLKAQGIDVNSDLFIKTFKETFTNTDSLDDYAIFQLQGQFRMAMDEAMQRAQEKKDAQAAEDPEAQQNALVGQNYINSVREEDPEVKTTESGLAYKIITPGTGVHPTASDRVRVHYTGRHIGGDVFDSSVERGEPADFPLSGVVPGFREGLQLLGKGGKATLYIPGELAYGLKGQPQADIRPNEMLVFEVELIDINPE